MIITRHAQEPDRSLMIYSFLLINSSSASLKACFREPSGSVFRLCYLYMNIGMYSFKKSAQPYPPWPS